MYFATVSIVPKYSNRPRALIVDANGDPWSSTNPYPIWPYAPDGTQITYTSENSDEAMDVHVSNSTIEKTHDDPAGSKSLFTGGKYKSTLDAVDDGDHANHLTGQYGEQVIALRADSAAVTSVSGSATSVALLAANVNRLGAIIYNDSTALLYVKLGTTASSSDFSKKLAQDEGWEIPYGYTGIIHGIWGSATGAALLTEAT